MTSSTLKRIQKATGNPCRSCGSSAIWAQWEAYLLSQITGSGSSISFWMFSRNSFIVSPAWWLWPGNHLHRRLELLSFRSVIIRQNLQDCAELPLPSFYILMNQGVIFPSWFHILPCFLCYVLVFLPGSCILPSSLFPYSLHSGSAHNFSYFIYLAILL